jgi:hypothetical protein
MRNYIGRCHFAFESMVPVNDNMPVFGAPKNNFFKASHNARPGFLFVGQSADDTRKGFWPSAGSSANVSKNSNSTDSPYGTCFVITSSFIF